MKNLTQKILELNPEDGISYLEVPGVFTFRSHTIEKTENTLYQPSMVFITSWSKKIYLDDKSYSYWKWKFLLVSFTTPFVCEASMEWEEVFAWLNIALNKDDFLSIIQNLKESKKPTKKKHNLEPGVLSLDVTDRIYNALDRLLECAKDPDEAKILWPWIIKEIMFYAIQESDAQAFYDLVLTNKNFWPFENMLEEINKNYKNDISINKLADDMDMSIPTFYRQFKLFTGFPPNQYIKNLRLSMAKNLLLLSNYSVKEAANEVWYNSQSQFSREYKRFHWYAPTMEWR